MNLNHKPSKLWVDQGKEFYNKLMQEWLDNDILLYLTHNEGKLVIAERFVKTFHWANICLWNVRGTFPWYIPRIFEQSSLWNSGEFLTSWKHFYNLTIFQGYPWNIFETEICRMFFEYSGNIALWLLEFSKRSTFVFVKSYIFNTKTTFPSRIC